MMSDTDSFGAQSAVIISHGAQSAAGESIKPDEREGEQASEQVETTPETQAASDSPTSDAPASDAPASTAPPAAEPASSAVAEEASESPETPSLSSPATAPSTSEEVTTEATPVPTGRILPADVPAPVEGALAEALTTLGVGEEEASASDGAAAEHKPQIDAKGRAYATGKRKDAVARVWLTPGSGNITVNGREFGAYFARPVLTMVVRRPLVLTERESQYDVTCTVRGGGLSGQAGAARHGISKALTFYEPELRSTLKKAGALTRDARVVERKKYGRRKARRSFQFSKR